MPRDHSRHAARYYVFVVMLQQHASIATAGALRAHAVPHQAMNKGNFTAHGHMFTPQHEISRAPARLDVLTVFQPDKTGLRPHIVISQATCSKQDLAGRQVLTAFEIHGLLSIRSSPSASFSLATCIRKVALHCRGQLRHSTTISAFE